MDRIPDLLQNPNHPAMDSSDDDDDDEWVLLRADNPADSSDDDRGVLALPASTSLLFLPSSSDDDDEDHQEDDETGDGMDSAGSSEEEDPFEVDEEEEEALPGRLARPLSGMFHHTPSDAVAYAAFDPVRSAKQLIPDPSFAAFPERVSVLASSRGLVCLRGLATGFYYLANPLTFRRVRLPYQTRDHHLDADPAVVIAFEDDEAPAGGFRHYHLVVAYQVHDGVWAVESFSTRTWDWRVGGDICAPETVVARSGVAARGRAFWRTTIGDILCYTPETGCVDLIPAPHEVGDGRGKDWEIGEMEGNLCVACVDQAAKEVAVLYMAPGHAAADDQANWAWAGQFHAHEMWYHDRMTLLRSQGAAEVVMWDPLEQLVLVVDLDGRVTRSIGPLSGGTYYSDFIPYVNSYADIYSEEEVGSVFKTNDEAVTYKVPQASVKAETDSN
uniref:Predicted protein n=1 Tax=Hordeum vulgare subsp. vulgare TaxID=112509 RepID=F2E0Q4_HORVV|nr:predicted protein [Hordeum vulgare subsp. vulgare]BAK01537.1 predicted protein [Hordeum vulgare subsp. vulgare]